VTSLTSINDIAKKEGELCLGVLSGINWETNPDLREKLEKGFEIIPEKLRLRIFTEKDREHFTSISPYFELNAEPGLEDITVLELEDTSTEEIFRKEFDPFAIALLAFRLLKAGGIFVDCVIAIEHGEVRRITYPTKPDFLPQYEFGLDNIEKLKSHLRKLKTVDFEKNSSFRIACTRFGRSYLDRFDEDKLVDLCIAFEALFLQGKRVRAPMGQVIGLACSMLLGKNIDERKMIKENIELAFSCRNDVVHGQDFDFDQIYRLIPNFEDYLRKSIFNLIL
jgi:hypothetical protein